VVSLRSVRRLLVTARVGPRSPIHVTLMKEALRSFERSVLKDTRVVLFCLCINGGVIFTCGLLIKHYAMKDYGCVDE
jgi:hypothetical protein